MTGRAMASWRWSSNKQHCKSPVVRMYRGQVGCPLEDPPSIQESGEGID